MKIVARLIPFAGALMLGACNSPSASNAPVDPRAAETSVKATKLHKIVGYSNSPETAPAYGEGLGQSGGGGHHH